MRTRLAVALLLLTSIAIAGEVYTWTDELGQVHFGDSLSADPDAEIVEIRINSIEKVSYESNASDQGVKNKKIIMYGTSWCGYCKKARNYFSDNGIAYKEYDVEKSAKGKREYEKLNGRGVPIILVGRSRMNGFSQATFDKLYFQ